MKNKKLAEQINERFESLRTARQEVEKRWQKSVQNVVPMFFDFGDSGEWKDQRFDTTATECASLLADGMMGNLCPQSVNWFMFRFEKNELNDDKELVEWLQEIQERIYESLHRSTFYDALPQYLKIGATIGTASMFIEEAVEDNKIVCNVSHPREAYVSVDRQGVVDTLYRLFTMTAYQASEFFGEDKLDPQIKNCLESTPDTEFEFIHAIEPRKMRDPRKADSKNFPYASYYVQKGKNEVIKEGGYKTFPAPTWRWEVRGNEAYGYSPTDDAMPDILMVNQMVKTMLIAQQKAVDPFLLLPKEMMNYSFAPGKRGHYTDPGRMPIPAVTGQVSPIMLEVLRDTRERIKKLYKVDHFLMLMQAGDQQMTAREVMERKSEKVTVTGSTIGKFATEALGKMLERIIQIEFDAGRLPAPPQGKDVSGATLKIDYLGPLAQAQKEMYAAQGVMQTITNAAAVLQLWPETLKKFKPEIMLEQILESSGMPEKAIRSDEEYQQILAAEAKQKQDMINTQMQIEQAKAMPGMSKRPEPGSPLESMMGGQ